MVGAQRGTHVGDKVFMGQTPVELEPFAGIGRVAGRVVPGAIGRRAGVDRAILSANRDGDSLARLPQGENKPEGVGDPW
jgi:hypothetical protein